ncbi:hypothetical protein SAY87_001876 [Trapa incisa]|uniref:Pentatricopeptide repeat-containing protein n=1 Tax=Trapa incisa TaxID=236973 RepID=A0AAN7JUZ4_9MYRT|nr:hypothetical protein SAY87_001876 [Trapa incisa]
MKAKGIQVNERACNLHMLAFSGCDEVEKCMEFFHRMIEYGLLADRCDGRALQKWRDQDGEGVGGGGEERSVSQLMEKEAVGINVHTYRLLLDCFTSSGKDEEAKGLLAGMHGKGLKVDAHSYSGE